LDDEKITNMIRKNDKNYIWSTAGAWLPGYPPPPL